jgi:regulator of sigma E protease
MLHNEVPEFYDKPVTLDWVAPGSAAAQAGFKPGDYIASYDGQQNPTWEQINVRSVLNLNHTVSAFVLRDGQRIPLQLPLADDSKGQEFTLGKVGLYPEIQPTPVKVAAVTPGLAAAKAGVQDGDLFDRIDGHAFHGTESIISYLKSRNGAPVNVVVDHNGKATQMTLQPTAVDVPEEGKAWRIGFAGNPPPMRVEHLPLLSATKESAKFCRANSLLIFEVLKRVLSHRMSVDTLSGPIGIAQQTGMAWEMKGWGPMIQLMTTISLNLGILNLLPFPILDGGMILFLLIEGAMQRDIDIRIKERVYQVAFVLILIFAAYVIFNDISKLATRT